MLFDQQAANSAVEGFSRRVRALPACCRMLPQSSALSLEAKPVGDRLASENGGDRPIAHHPCHN
ncbi:hypothetical protein Q31a_11160 [Aureliella helgolandensis]|uniref:Uncharacterized protein n=1 Tax=Aureliella helgolandensis TaxID=2527968 RepID=A0A518G2P3_9BACT|nr:hypothetical protein Q31a_11160 [Aureliella helgolandensis]